MLVTDINKRDMFLAILKTLNNGNIGFSSNCKVAESEDKKHVAIYVEYLASPNILSCVTSPPEIIILKFVDDEVNGFEISARILMPRSTLITGLDINYDGTQLAVGCTNIYVDSAIPNEEYVRAGYLKEGEWLYYDLTPKANNVLFGYNVLFINGRDTSNGKDNFKYSILIIASPLARNGRGDFHILGSTKGNEFKEVELSEIYFDRLLDPDSICTDFFGYNIEHLEYVGNFIEMRHDIDISEEIIKLVPIEYGEDHAE